MSALRVRLLSATTVAAVLAAATTTHAQTPASPAAPGVVKVATAASGSIYGAVVDESGAPVEGAVVSALGGATAFAVTDSAGQYRLSDLPAGPYVVRAHRDGFAAVRSTLVNVRPSQKAPSSFTLRHSDTSAPAAVQTAGVDLPSLDPAAPRDDSPRAWRLRRLTRSVLKEDTGTIGDPADAEWFAPAQDEGFLSRAFDASARLAASIFSDSPLKGQVNLLTATAFDDSGEMVAFGPSTGVAFFSVGAPVGANGDWSARGAMNGGDVTSWTMAGDYRSRASAPHQLTFGVTYGLQSYRGGNVAALQAVPEGHRKVASLYASHEFAVAPGLTVGYGARYDHFDYLDGRGLVSPSIRTTVALTSKTRVHASASVKHVVPGAEEFVAPTDAWVPPQRTFAPLTGNRFDTEQVRHGEIGVTRTFGAADVSVTTFVQSVDDQLVTVFGAADPARLVDAGGHYGVASAGDALIHGWRVAVEREFLPHVYGKTTFTTLAARWSGPRETDRRALAAAAPEALTPDTFVQDLTTSLDAELPQTDTRIYVLYRMSSGFTETPAVPMGRGRFDVQLRQGLPLSDRVGEWDMLFGVRSLFRSALEERSSFDELLVVRAPKRVICGLQVRF